MPQHTYAVVASANPTALLTETAQLIWQAIGQSGNIAEGSA